MNRGLALRTAAIVAFSLCLWTSVVPSGWADDADEGWAALEKGEYDDALRFFTRAIVSGTTKKKLGVLYVYRGGVYYRRGLFGEALADFNKAIDMEPKSAGPLAFRGHVHFARTNFAQAAQDYLKALQIDPSGTWVLSWLYVARERSQQDGKAAVAAHLQRVDRNTLDGKILSVLMGDASPEGLIERLTNNDPDKQKQAQAMAAFFLGQYYLIRGQANQARLMFRHGVDTNLHLSLARSAALLELKKLE
jgi:lipoprotein NlpI